MIAFSITGELNPTPSKISGDRDAGVVIASVYKDKNVFLYMCYSSEKTFGCSAPGLT